MATIIGHYFAYLPKIYFQLPHSFIMFLWGSVTSDCLIPTSWVYNEHQDYYDGTHGKGNSTLQNIFGWKHFGFLFLCSWWSTIRPWLKYANELAWWNYGTYLAFSLMYVNVCKWLSYSCMYEGLLKVGPELVYYSATINSQLLITIFALIACLRSSGWRARSKGGDTRANAGTQKDRWNISLLPLRPPRASTLKIIIVREREDTFDKSRRWPSFKRWAFLETRFIYRDLVNDHFQNLILHLEPINRVLFPSRQQRIISEVLSIPLFAKFDKFRQLNSKAITFTYNISLTCVQTVKCFS